MLTLLLSRSVTLLFHQEVLPRPDREVSLFTRVFMMCHSLSESGGVRREGWYTHYEYTSGERAADGLHVHVLDRFFANRH